MILVVIVGILALTVGVVWSLLMVRSLTYGDWPPFVRRRMDIHDAIPVIMYHDVTEKQFEKDMCYLDSEGYRALSLEQFAGFLLDHGHMPFPKGVLLTFDDGLLSTYQIAFPILCRRGWPAVCFVAPALIGEGRQRDDHQGCLEWKGRTDPPRFREEPVGQLD